MPGPFPKGQPDPKAKVPGLFDKAIPLANTELEMAQICGLRAAASAQTNVSERLGIQLPTMMGP